MIRGITGAHWVFFSTDADVDRAFMKDVLGWNSVDAGGGWLIFAMPPAEVAVHPGGGDFVQQQAGNDLLGGVLYLMCDDVDATVKSLEERGVQCEEIADADWGRFTSFQLPSGGGIGLYQPKHPVAI